MPIGRPSLYRVEYCEELLAHMSEGLSFESFAGKIDVNPDTLYEWCSKHPEFSEAKKRAQARCLLWWEILGKNGMFEKQFRDALYIFNMKARFRWADQLIIRDGKDDEERERIAKLPTSELIKLLKEESGEDE